MRFVKKKKKSERFEDMRETKMGQLLLLFWHFWEAEEALKLFYLKNNK